jgi:hypothetical protein
MCRVTGVEARFSGHLTRAMIRLRWALYTCCEVARVCHLLASPKATCKYSLSLDTQQPAFPIWYILYTISSMRFRGDIEGLRAVAVLLVIAAHLDLSGFSGGFVGVDVFFVISGYLITGLLLAEHERRLDGGQTGGASPFLRSIYVELSEFYLRRS